MAKKLGGEGIFLAKSKQLRVKIGNFSSGITADKKNILVNGEQDFMSAAAVVASSKIYVPADFFLNKNISASLKKQITFSDGKYFIEDFYNIEYAGTKKDSGVSHIYFIPKGEIVFKTVAKNKSVIEIEFENSVMKRRGKFKIADGLTNNFSIKKCGNSECVRFLLEGKAKDWNFGYDGDKLVFKAFDKAQPVISSGTGSLISAAPAPQKPAPKKDSSGTDGKTSSISAVPGPVVSAKPGPVISVAPVKITKTKMKIVVDPGHGGKDPGAVRKNSSREKDINLGIAQELYNLLKKKGFDVKITRDSDKFLALNERSKMANDFKADLFISVHTNSAPRIAASGFEVYFRSAKASDAQAAEVAAFENEALQYEETNFNFADMLLRSLAVNEYVNESSKLAGHVRNNVKSIAAGTGIPVNLNSSVKQANFYVLKGVDAPAVLVECGYISNPSDRKQLNNKVVRAKVAEGIYKGILSYAKAEGWQ
jgi:N-acetylmuramoyl-L-alanine amidase